MSGMSKSDPRARLIRTARPLFGAGPLADDRADDRQRHAHPQPAEDARQGGRDLEGREDLAPRRPEAAPELEQPRVDRADADHRRDRDREEDDQRADDDLAQQPRAEPHDEQRRQHQDRDRLGRHEIRRQRAADEQVAPGEPVAGDQRRAPARPRSRAATSTIVVTKCGQTVPSSHAVDEPLADGLRRREDERREPGQDHDRLPDER